MSLARVTSSMRPACVAHRCPAQVVAPLGRRIALPGAQGTFAPAHEQRTSSPRWTVAQAASPEGSTVAAEADIAVKRAELVRGCQIVLQELKGLDFSRSEARLYFKLSANAPKGLKVAKGVEMERARACLEQLLDGDEEGYSGPKDALNDLEAMKATQAILSEIWRWRRRGGGMDDEDTAPPHVKALREINRMDKEDIDRVTSTLLDALPITDAQKSEMGGAVQQGVMAGINGAVWGSLVLCLLFLVVFNFLRSG